MEHFYQKIQGWFTFSNLYSDMVKKYNDANFVEVGTWLGRSAAYMAAEIINQQKNINFFCVDTWEGSAEHKKSGLSNNRDLYNEFLNNISPARQKIIPYKTTSLQASALFQDESLDFVFIDASHDYENVMQDLKAWYPKVKQGGVFAGHDYPGWPGVKQAVDEFFDAKNKKIQAFQQCWCIEL